MRRRVPQRRKAPNYFRRGGFTSHNVKPLNLKAYGPSRAATERMGLSCFESGAMLAPEVARRIFYRFWEVHFQGLVCAARQYFPLATGGVKAAETVMRQRAATEGSSWARGRRECRQWRTLRLGPLAFSFGSEHSSQL